MDGWNYFNYFTEIEEYFWKKRGAHLLVSPLDWAIMETWQKAGVPLEAVRRHQVANPMVLIDEIDKAGASRHNGALVSALLPFLEPENARAYPDPYVQSEVDLAHVNYILTCNDDSVLPAPLKDRLRIIRLPRPTIAHLPALARGIVADIAKERGGDARFFPGLNDPELAVAEALWARGGSVRRLRAIVERLLAYREEKPRQ